jgi:GT2 family glycosyltransferase
VDNLKNITIGVVTYNNADEIGELLDSITECSSFHDLTVYLYDNASTDNTAGVVKEKYPWVRLIEGKKKSRIWQST